MNNIKLIALPLAGLVILAAMGASSADKAPAHPMMSVEVLQQIEHLWDMDEIRKTPLDPQIINSTTANGWKTDEIYITSRITPQGPDRVFFIFARPVQPAKKPPIYIDVSGGGDPGNVTGGGRSLNCASVNIEWRNPHVQHHSIWAEHADKPAMERSMWIMKPDIKNSITYAFEVGIMRVIDYLAQQPDVDASRIAIGGSSYGGWYSLFSAAIDPRITCVNAVWAAGGLDGEKSANGILFKENLPEDEKSAWTAAYDVLTYTPRIKASTLMTEATNDFSFWVGDAVNNFNALTCEKRLLLIPNCNHGQMPFGLKLIGSEGPWVQHCLNGEPIFPSVTNPVAKNATYSWKATGPYPITKATLYYSPGQCVWPGRYWIETEATQVNNEWSATLPEQFAKCCGEVFVTIADDHDRRISSVFVVRDGIDPGTSPCPLWSDGAMWDVAHGASAWRPIIGIDPPGEVQTNALSGIKIIPKAAEARFALITNSVILASGVASTHTGIRLVIDGAGEAGELNVAMVRRAGSYHEEVTQGQISYVKPVAYGASVTTIDIPWADFKGPKEAPALPYPFDGMRLIGKRSTLTPLTIQSIMLY